MKKCLTNIRLRAMEPEDLEFLYGIENDEDVWSVGVTNVPYSRRMLLDYITSSTGDIYTDKQVRLVIENERQEPIGVIDLIDFAPSHARAELGIVIQKAYRGMGYGTSVLAKILDYSKSVLHLHQIYAFVAENNENCIKMLKSAGFQSDKCLQDWLFDGEKYENALFFQRFL